MAENEPTPVWSASLDGGKYQVRVDRISPLPAREPTREAAYRGMLRAYHGDKLIYEEEVGLSYGAIFGPDVDDVAEWQDLVIAAVDKYEGKA